MSLHPGQVANRDSNYVPGVIVTDFQDATQTVEIKGDSATGRMLVNSVGTTQIVDGSGNAVTVTGNKLDVNATFSGSVTTAPTFAQNPTAPTPTPMYGLVDASGVVQVAGTLTASGTQDVNITKVAGSAISQGHGTAATAIRVELPTDGTGKIATVDTITNTVTVTGSVTTGGLTDTQLRATAVPVSLTSTTITGTVAATQSGAWTNTVTQATASNLNATVVGTGTLAVQLTGATNNINNISGTISLPTGASTLSAQTTGNSSLSSIDSKLSGTILTDELPLTTITAFVTTVTTAGTRVQLSSTSVDGGILEADPDNTDGTYIYVGGSNVSNTVWGAKLLPGQSTSVAIDNTNKIYIDSSANGNKCGFLGSS